jgi:uncharacterized protein
MVKHRKFLWVSVGFALGLILLLVAASCSPAVERVKQETVTDLPNPALRNKTPNPTSTPSPSRTPLPSPTASATITATRTPSLHPMSILGARQTSYPGSLITIEETLEPGSNYDRYIAWYESQGLRIYGLLTVPSGEMPANGWPAIVFNHGYIPPDEYRTTERYIAYVGNLASHGYIVYKIDYRGHDRSEGEATGAYGNPGYTTDVLNAVSALQAFPQADAQRIGMWGHSMGGFLTLRAMVISEDIKAGVIWSGVVASYPDLICCWHQPAPGLPTITPNPNYRSSWRREWQNLYGSPQDNPEFWMGISANAYLKDLSGPIQLHASTGDSEVPVKFSQDLYQQILSAESPVPVEYYEYEGDNHNLAGNFTLAMTRTIEFFDRYLKDGR